MLTGSLMPASSSRWAQRLEEAARRHPAHRFLLGETDATAALGELDALVAAHVAPRTVEAARSLRALFIPLTGLNHLPVRLLAERGVAVYNVHANAESVAQNALAMILAHFGRVIEYHEALRDETWHGFWVGRGAEDEWSTIFRKRCAILGTGAIGSALARLLQAFGCEVVGWRRRAEAPLPLGFSRVEATLEEAIRGAEIVVVALPLTPETHGAVSRELLLSMKGVFLVNVGRGATVDEEGLWLALRDGVLAGAGLDVWYAYPEAGSRTAAPSRFPIHRLPSVILSPHVGGSTSQAASAAVEHTIANLEMWLETGSAPTKVDLLAMY